MESSSNSETSSETSSKTSSETSSENDPSETEELPGGDLKPEELDDLVATIAATADWKFSRLEGKGPPSADIGQETSAKKDLKRRLKLLNDSDINKLIGMKVPDVNGGKLTVLGHLCVTASCPIEVSKILFSKADVNLLEEFDGQRTPLLHLAAYCGNEDVVKFFGEKVKALDFYSKTSANLTALHMGVKSRRDDIIYDICFDAWRRLSHVDSITETIDIITDLVNGKDDLGMTPLHYAAWEDSGLALDDLLRFDQFKTKKCPRYNIVDVNGTDNGGFTALHLASWHNHLGVVNSLLKHRHIDTTGRSGSLMRIAKKDPGEDLQSKLDQAESHLRQFSIARQRSLHPGSSEKMEERKEWEDENRTRAAGLLFPGSDLNDNENLTALHCAACQGHLNIVAALVKKISNQERAKTTLNALDKHGMTALHHAVMGGDASLVEELLSSPMVRGNMREERGYLTPLNMAYVLEKGDHLKDTASLEERHLREIKREYNVIIGLLSEQPDVKAYTESLYRERQLYVDAANAILVGAALIASITFAGWLQPPLGYQQYYETNYLLTGSAPPDTYASYAAVGQHVSVQIFWISNSLSFFFAVTTVLIGACVVLPMVVKSQLELDVKRMQRLHIWTTLALSLSVFFVLGAFVAAGFASLPPRLEYQWGMIMTTATGGWVGLGALTYYLYRVITLIRSILEAPKNSFARKMKN